MGNFKLEENFTHTHSTQWQAKQRDQAREEANPLPSQAPRELESSSQSADATERSNRADTLRELVSVVESSWLLPSSTSAWKSSIWRVNALTSTRRRPSPQDTSNLLSATMKN